MQPINASPPELHDFYPEVTVSVGVDMAPMQLSDEPAGDIAMTTNLPGMKTEEPADPSHELPPRIATHEVTLSKLIGEGGFAKVWYGHWLTTPIAVKVDKTFAACSTEQISERAASEAALLMKLRHPCVCAFYGTALVGGRHALVLEYLEGGSLSKLLRTLRSHGEGSDALLPLKLLYRMVSEIASGLAFLHRNGVIHRDVKSENVRVAICARQLTPPALPSLHQRASPGWPCLSPCHSRRASSLLF